MYCVYDFIRRPFSYPLLARPSRLPMSDQRERIDPLHIPIPLMGYIGRYIYAQRARHRISHTHNDKHESGKFVRVIKQKQRTT